MLENKNSKVLDGNCFVSFEKTSEHAFELFTNQLDKNSEGLRITRDHTHKENDGFENYWMNQKTLRKNTIILEDISQKIKTSLKNKNKTTILLERVDYLINLYGFESFLKFIYSVNEEIITSNSTLIVHANPFVISEKEQHLLKLELSALPRPDYVERIRLSKDLFDIIELVKSTETKVNFKNICKNLSITKATARKRIYELQTQNLVFIRKDGRSKIIELTSEADNLG